MTTNHPAHGPVSLDRLHQIREILSKAAAQSDGGNLGYAMADAVKVIDGAIAAFGAEPVEFLPDNLDRALTILGVALPISKEEFNLDAERWMQRLINRVIRLESELIPPAPVVPDEYRHLSELYHAQEKRLFKLAQRIKGLSFDKYAHSPSQAIDVLEAAIFGDSEDACCAAMIQGKVDDEVGSWNNHMNTPTAKPAIDTGEPLKHIEGMEVSVDVSTCDADAGHRYFGTVTEISELDTAKNGYILLVQDAKPNFKPAGNSPVTPDGWQLVPKEPTEAMNKAGWAAMNEHDAINPTYRAMLAAAPQQEVKSAFEHGMQRYAGAMQKLADAGD
ncbi:hypothetical protein NFL11_10515 [Citrobacter braakii]|uniref:hypothetical protein n=1 Tax=Citrobacter braakii TaxID=57706 RepID=UPI0024329DE6|nr:hypothetical protein [Citrobacter braakii]WGA86166.1 hypothetical protein NFL11_10515 [Citrobacter braakii]